MGGALLFLLLIGWILNLGHRLHVVERLMRRESPCFRGFSPWGQTFLRGLRAFSAISVYLSPSALMRAPSVEKVTPELRGRPWNAGVEHHRQRSLARRRYFGAFGANANMTWVLGYARIRCPTIEGGSTPVPKHVIMKTDSKTVLAEAAQTGQVYKPQAGRRRLQLFAGMLSCLLILGIPLGIWSIVSANKARVALGQDGLTVKMLGTRSWAWRDIEAFSVVRGPAPPGNVGGPPGRQPGGHGSRDEATQLASDLSAGRGLNSDLARSFSTAAGRSRRV